MVTSLFITWNVDPGIFTIGSFELRYYGLLFGLGFVVDYFLFKRFFKDAGLSAELLDNLTVWTIVATIAGARLGHCLFYEADYYLSNPIEIFKIWKGGLASHGAAIGIPVGIYLFSRKNKMNFFWIIDRIVIAVAVTGAFVRLGNLMNSEIYGGPTSLPWGFRFIENMYMWRKGGEPIFSVPSHPTQIYESLFCFVVFGFLLWAYFKRKEWIERKGLFFGIFLVLIFVFRFFIEFIKNAQVEAEANMALKIGQYLSLPFIALGIYFIVHAIKRPADSTPFKSGAIRATSKENKKR